jgi:hypothetical protein
MHYKVLYIRALKGQMSAAELHVLKQRLLSGRWAKAARGELKKRVPMGYVRRLSGEVVKDPDEQAQAVIALVFSEFERQGTVFGVLRYLVKHGIELPCRLVSGPRKGELEWRRVNRQTLSNILRHPMYAGAYVYGLRTTDPRRQKPGQPATGKVLVAPEDWPVLLKDHYPAYISWAQFERNLAQLEANGNASLGAVRHGSSLLSGLLVCGRCGRRMSTYYSYNGHRLSYRCTDKRGLYGGEICQTLAGSPLDHLVSDVVLRALQPAALAISLQVAADLEAQRQRLHQQWAQRLERARLHAERTYRQYDATEPEHRLVSRTLDIMY